ncbi:MAG: LysR family transcriptional regulator [Dethiobacter sp.]|nr:LysR family transcriptional regulator [Dethiobacter sp.]
MEFYQLEAFVMVVSQRSFSRAADMLYLSQPTVSAHVKSLENTLGTALFDRGKGEIMLTPAGETLYRYACDMLDLRKKTICEISEKKVSAEVLTMAASSVPCQYFLPGAIARFEKKIPTATVCLKQENSRRVCESVFNYQYPLGVVGERHNLPRLAYVPLMEDILVAAIPNREEYKSVLARKELSVEDLTEFRLLLREPGSGTRSLLEKELQRVGVGLGRFRISIYESQETIKQAVRQGLGVTVISRFVVEDYEQFGLLSTRPLRGLELARRFSLVYHDKRVLSNAGRELRRFLISFFTAEEEK